MTSTTVDERPCTLLVSHGQQTPPNSAEIKAMLEHGDERDKVEALEHIITLQLAGEKLPGLLITVIKFAMPSKDKRIKKLLLVYWEVVDKRSEDNKLLPEFILVCNDLRNDLNHPNEYVRGTTLRFLCKLKEPELLEPLVPSVRANLEHRHSYVRRNAVLALYSIFKDFESLVPDAPELMFNFLCTEGDHSCKRNAFMMLVNTAQDKAVEYLMTVIEEVPRMNEIFQFAVIDLVKKVAANSTDRSRYVRCVISLLDSKSPAVQFDAAGALVQLSGHPTAVKAATSTYISLLVDQFDNNVKLIALDRLFSIKLKHGKVISELVMDVLKALSCRNLDIKQKTLEFALDLVTPRNIDEVIQVLKKEVNSTQALGDSESCQYRQMLVKAIHSCAVRFPDVASNVCVVLLDFVGDSNVASAIDVIRFLREVVEKYPALRSDIAKKLLETMDQIRAAKVFRAALWIVGEYSTTTAEIDEAVTTIKEMIGSTPLYVDEDEEAQKEKELQNGADPTASGVGGKTAANLVDEVDQAIDAAAAAKSKTARMVLPDGTYATQSSFVDPTQDQASIKKTASNMAQRVPPLRALLLSGDFFLASVVSSTLTKLVLKLKERGSVGQAVLNRLSAEVLLVMTGILRLGNSRNSPFPIDKDSTERLYMCAHILTHTSELAEKVLLEDCRSSLRELLGEMEKLKAAETTDKKQEVKVQADACMSFRQLRSKRAYGTEEDIVEGSTDLARATGLGIDSGAESRLSKVYQLTGFSDPIYAEAYVEVHQYDIVLDVVVINQTSDTLQNVCLELATLGDLKLCERPQNYTVGPHDKKSIRANIKVSSTETGIIFGNLVYDIAGRASTGADRNCVILNDIHIDVIDYINPATCTDVAFRTMWAEFEWENKVVVNTSIADLQDFLKHVLTTTNMKCLTPHSALDGNCNFLAANLYARSIFGEDALANLSIEKQADSRISGYIRIRSKTQGIALSLGDKITLKQQRAELAND
eukprot:TRINITY_DN2254_c0_g1_i1.p1 TRINITY_DN2254_c0_g1~~TRINITY_DN2254_c0_g1_i1.p1  ORF type:complete len:988 (+),score=320.12 TRINITY_DN2254_c0_g1_i1:123-3086(+)